ncbi:MAG: hypothetical protein HPY79_11965 [Bacteroidales bacterium]|nr:hypothetical protein [Bacteroidales bacterium]
MKKLFYFLSILIITSSCNFNKSVSFDANLNIKSQGDGISCENITITDKKQREFKTSTFIYGQEIFFNFNQVEGLVKENNRVFPGLKLLILSASNDTVLYSDDLYAEIEEGFDYSPLKLTANITFANPMHSNQKYTAYLMIWDKKGTGTFKVEFHFNITPNPNIKVKTKNVSYKEIYLFDNTDNLTITDNIIDTNKKIYILFEGLDGFVAKNDSINCGISLRVSDKNGNIMLDESDLMKNSKMSVKEFTSQVAPFFLTSPILINF